MFDGNEQPVNDESVNSEDFIKSINGSAETVENHETPEKIGEFDTGDYFKAMETISDGSVSNFEQFKESLSYKSKYGELEQKYNQLDAQSKISPYTNDLSKEINELYRLGATNDEVQGFLKLQNMDVDGMNSADSIKLQMKMSADGQLSNEDVDSWYEDVYGDDGDEITGAQKVKLIQDAKAAKEFLNSRKVDSGQPAVVLKQRQAEENFKRNNNFWSDVVTKTITNYETQSFPVNIGKDENGEAIELNYDFPVPKEGRDMIASETARWAAMNNLGGNEADYQKVKLFSERLLWAQYGPEIMGNAVRNAKSKATETVTQKHHNIRPLGQGNKQEKISPQDKSKVAKKKKKIRKSGPF